MLNVLTQKAGKDEDVLRRRWLLCPESIQDAYWLEDHRLAMIPVPQRLPAVVNDLGKMALPGELLLMGAVDFDHVDSCRKTSRVRNWPLTPQQSVFLRAFGCIILSRLRSTVTRGGEKDRCSFGLA